MKKLSLPQLNVTQASVTALFIYGVGQVIAFVPSLSSEKTQLISVGSLVIAAVFMGVHAVHAAVSLISQYVASKNKVTLAELEDGIRNLAKDEIGKVNVDGVVQSVLSTKKLPSLDDIEQLIVGHLDTFLKQHNLVTGDHLHEAVRGVLAELAGLPPVAPPPDIQASSGSGAVGGTTLTDVLAQTSPAAALLASAQSQPVVNS